MSDNRASSRIVKALDNSVTHIPTINRVGMKVNNQGILCVNKPEVYKSNTADTYLIIGTLEQDNMIQMFQKAAANKMGDNPVEVLKMMEEVKEKKEESEAVEVIVEDEDAGDIPQEEIDAVMSQTGASRGKTIGALKKYGTMVDAIVALSG